MMSTRSHHASTDLVPVSIPRGKSRAMRGESIPRLPLPNHPFDGGITVASRWGCETKKDGPVIWAALLQLMYEAPFYRVLRIDWRPTKGWNVKSQHREADIQDAASAYAEL